MWIQDLRDTTYNRKTMFSHKRGRSLGFRWEYCISKYLTDDIIKATATLGGEEERSVSLSFGLLGSSVYLTFPNLLPSKYAIGWYKKGETKNPRWDIDSHGRKFGFYFCKDALVIDFNATVMVSGTDTSKYGYSWYLNTPWSYGACVRDDVLTKSGKLEPSQHSAMSKYVLAQKRGNPSLQFSVFDLKIEDFPDPAFYENADYTYVLNSGEVQNRRATFFVSEREWRWCIFHCLPFRFGPKTVQRAISVVFDDEVGEGTGSFKGGTVGCGYEMNKGETPIQTLRRMERERKF